MEDIKSFFESKCEIINEEHVLLETEFSKIQFVINDDELNTRRSTKVDNVVRFLNPKVDIVSNLVDELSIVDEYQDFDELLVFIEENKVEDEHDYKYYNHILNPEVFPLFFLPSYIEDEIKKVTVNKKRKKINIGIKKFFSDEQVEKFELKFTEKDNQVDLYDHAISFYKFFDATSKNECVSFEEIEKKINEIKYKLKTDYIQSFDYYFIGCIEKEMSLIERDEKEDALDPYYFHYSVWKLKEYESRDVFQNFKLYPFLEKKVV